MASLKDWHDGTTSGLVELPTHKLFLRAAGSRRPGDPAVVIEAGLGHSSVYWTAVMRLISPFARIYAYDRSGQGDSEPSTLPRTAQNMALELSLLLEEAQIPGPYILVAHSYGGIIVRELLELPKGKDVAGLVLVDARTEYSDARRPAGLESCNNAVFDGLDFTSVLKLESRHKLNDDELGELIAEGSEEDTKKRGEATTAELENYPAGCDKLAGKKQFERHAMGERPVSVVKGNNGSDMKLLLDAGTQKGNGTEEQRAVIRGWLADPELEISLQAEQLRLTKEGRGRMVFASESGHDVQLIQPEVIAEEVQWILKVLEEDGKKS